jgi:membrane protein
MVSLQTFRKKGIFSLSIIGAILKKTFLQWKDRDPFNNSAIIAYYTIFSLPGLLVIIFNATGYFFNEQEIQTQITREVQAIMGGDIARDIEDILINARKAKGTLVSTILSLATLLFGATGVFYELQQMLNRIWKVQPKTKRRQKIWVLIRDRLFSFGLILVVGFLLLVSLVLSAGLSAFSSWVAIHLSESLNSVFRFLDIFISIVIITALFAALFKFLPDVKIKWRDVWPAALLTSSLFVVAKFALGYYFGQSTFVSTYGAAGSVILIMLWVSYTGMILLFGAELTHVYITLKYAKKNESEIELLEPEKDSVNHRIKEN